MVSIKRALPVGFRMLAASGVQVSHTGNTNETALATVTIPAGAMGPNGRLRIRAVFSHTNGADDKIGRLRLGGISGTIHWNRTFTTTALNRLDWEIANRNAQNSQVGWQAGSSSFETSAGALTTSAIDTSAATTLVFSTQLENGVDTASLESYTVEIFYQA